MNVAILAYAFVVTVLLVCAVLNAVQASREAEHANRAVDQCHEDGRAAERERTRLIQERDAARAEVIRLTPVKGERGRFVARA